MERRLTTFEDILDGRRKELSNVLWSGRDKSHFLVPNRRIQRVTPNTHKKNVLNSTRIQEVIAKVSSEKNVPKEELEEQIRLILDEIGFQKSSVIIRCLAVFLCKFTCKICTHLYVNKESLNCVKEELGNTPTIYVPSHRSYADFILMSFMLFSKDMEIPAIAAGMDFHGMMGMGTMLRNTGAFFMRRIYNNDSLYWDTFRQYVHDLVTKGDVGVEFFLEGTRSRSCKSLNPKYGLLFMILRAFVIGEVPDILFVPINISYDRVMEEKLFAFELLGVPKPKETTSGFFKALSIVRENFGNIYMDFGKPISVRKYFGGKLNREQHTMKPLHLQDLLEEEKLEITKLADHIVHAQQKLSTITTFNLIAVILSNNLTMRQTIMRYEQLVVEVIWLKNVLEKFGAFTDVQNPREDVASALKVHKNLISVDDLTNVTLIQNAIVLDNFKESRLKGHSLSETTMTISVPFVMLQIYVNPSLHYFFNPALLVAIIKSSGCQFKVPADKLLDEFKFLRKLFSFEFFNLKDNIEADFAAAANQLKTLNVITEETEDVFSIADNTKVTTLLINLLDPFFYCYFVVFNVLLNLKTSNVEEKFILANSQARLEELLYAEEEFVHPYVLSLDTISMCLQSLVSLQVLTKARIDNTFKYNAHSDVLLDINNKMQKYVEHKKSLSLAETYSGHKLKNKL